jgi:hypothetical protein
VVSGSRWQAVISTNLRPTTDLFDNAQQRDAAVAALGKFFSRCPADGSGNICSGRGWCDWRHGQCQCLSSREGGRCENLAVCRTVDCGYGHCDPTSGLCVCDGGWTGCNCRERCGRRQFLNDDFFEQITYIDVQDGRKEKTEWFAYDCCDGAGRCGNEPAQCFCDRQMPGSKRTDQTCREYSRGQMRSVDVCSLNADGFFLQCEWGPSADDDFFTFTHHEHHCRMLSSVTCEYEKSECKHPPRWAVRGLRRRCPVWRKRLSRALGRFVCGG